MNAGRDEKKRRKRGKQLGMKVTEERSAENVRRKVEPTNEDKE